MSNFTYRICELNEKEAVTDVFFANQEALCLPDRAAAAKISDLLFAKGYVLGGYHNDQLVAALGYFLGEPANKIGRAHV